MAFDEEELASFGGTGMDKQAHVGIDKKSGQIEGWDSIWAILKLEDEERKQIEGIQAPNRPKDGGQEPIPKVPEQVVESRLENLSGYRVE